MYDYAMRVNEYVLLMGRLNPLRCSANDHSSEVTCYPTFTCSINIKAPGG